MLSNFIMAILSLRLFFAYAVATAALFIVINFIRLGGIRAGIARLNAYNSKEIN